MPTMIVVLLVAAFTYFATRAFYRKKDVDLNSEIADLPLANVENINTDKFAQLMAAPPTKKSIQQSLHPGLIETSSGIWRTKEENAEEQLHWRRWRTTLNLVPINVSGEQVRVEHNEIGRAHV